MIGDKCTRVGGFSLFIKSCHFGHLLGVIWAYLFNSHIEFFLCPCITVCSFYKSYFIYSSFFILEMRKLSLREIKGISYGTVAEGFSWAALKTVQPRFTNPPKCVIKYGYNGRGMAPITPVSYPLTLGRRPSHLVFFTLWLRLPYGRYYVNGSFWTSQESQTPVFPTLERAGSGMLGPRTSF